ncbi:adenylosuccinate synthase [Collinsella sp. AGMB00827]|uniref:Adenylosuccinate synthetase n=1 Tax=Collinsella ureilytica TaxID=2869515 RepID=A0ABS7ML57_9ACTN|nr:adenylosuccinate synthase [Collinsella urealyticum]MBY4797783.1 adenylosuccinate synthase [Collinsella urealyticum]
MGSTVLVGTQWGDEGKGKICDLIAPGFDAVVRYQGGNNAGHTIVVGERKYGLHQIPSGIMYPDCLSVIGNGCVVNPKVLLEEIAMFEHDGISTANLKVSGNAHIIMPYHIALDGAFEHRLGEKLIGTTKRGIGPCYQHKMDRIGLRMQDMLDEQRFREKLELALIKVNPELEYIYQLPTYTVQEICDEYLPYAEQLRSYIAETGMILNDLAESGGSILFEGAQATLLDIDHGTYPFVTSSNCTAGGAVTGSGVGMGHIDRILGIMKAYITRVGSGPMPTELDYDSDPAGHTLTEEGGEYGVTTGRRRRCGWFDGVIANYAARVNGLTDIALTKLDVLSVFDTIKVCIAYECEGIRYTCVPEHQDRFDKAVPIYQEVPGWKCDITGCKSFNELPEEARSYVGLIEELAHTPVSYVSVGPAREQTIIR